MRCRRHTHGFRFQHLLKSYPTPSIIARNDSVHSPGSGGRCELFQTHIFGMKIINPPSARETTSPFRPRGSNTPQGRVMNARSTFFARLVSGTKNRAVAIRRNIPGRYFNIPQSSRELLQPSRFVAIYAA